MTLLLSDLQRMLIDGQWLDAIQQFFTGGGDPTLQVVMPTALYGGLLLALFTTSSSSVLPTVVSIILAGVIFTAFPATAVTVVLILVLFTIAVGGQVLTWRMGR